MRHLHWVIAGLTAVLAIGAAASGQDEAATTATSRQAADEPKQQLYDEQADARAVIREAVARASKENKRVLVQWGANWCGWCHRLQDLFKTDRAVQRKLQYEYELVHVDVGRFDRNLELADELGAELKKTGIPFLTILDGEGEVLLSQETGSLEAEVDGRPGHDAQKVLALLTEHQAPYRSAERVLSEGLARAQAEGKKVFLHFGAPWCGWCRRLESWMATEDVARVLGRHFVDVKVDIERTIGGKALMARYTEGRQTGIPFSAVLAPDGEVAARSFMPDGSNFGCPHSDEEIAAFSDMLARAGCSDDERAALTASLVTARDRRK